MRVREEAAVRFGQHSSPSLGKSPGPAGSSRWGPSRRPAKLGRPRAPSRNAAGAWRTALGVWTGEACCTSPPGGRGRDAGRGRATRGSLVGTVLFRTGVGGAPSRRRPHSRGGGSGTGGAGSACEPILGLMPGSRHGGRAERNANWTGPAVEDADPGRPPPPTLVHFFPGCR